MDNGHWTLDNGRPEMRLNGKKTQEEWMYFDTVCEGS